MLGIRNLGSLIVSYTAMDEMDLVSQFLDDFDLRVNSTLKDTEPVAQVRRNLNIREVVDNLRLIRNTLTFGYLFSNPRIVHDPGSVSFVANIEGISARELQGTREKPSNIRSEDMPKGHVLKNLFSLPAIVSRVAVDKQQNVAEVGAGIFKE